MGNLIIKPNTSGELILQDEGGSSAISISTAGVATFAVQPIFTDSSYTRGGLKTWEVPFTSVNNAAITIANFTVPDKGAFSLEMTMGSEQWYSYSTSAYHIGVHSLQETPTVQTMGYIGASATVGTFEYSKDTDTNFQVRKTAGNAYSNVVNGFIRFTATMS